MDKYEFNIKVGQIKKLAEEKDYVTAMKIADGIDWSRVRNANLLSMVAGVYEKNGEYQEAKDILLLAFERAPVGKRLLFKLAELSVRSGDIDEAEDFYREFTDLAPDDSRAFLLEYLILKAKGAPASQLIHSLEQYTAQELDERWLYELAELYARAGMGAECVRLCDKITLLFGLGKYSERAMQLKQNFANLSDYQRDLVENRGKYEDNLKRVEAESARQEAMYERNYADADGEASNASGAAGAGAAGAVRDESNDDGFSEAQSDALANQRYDGEDADFEAYLRAHSKELELGEETEGNGEASGRKRGTEKAEAAAAPEPSVSYDDQYLNEGFADDLSREVRNLQDEDTSDKASEEAEETDLEKTRVLDEALKEKLRHVVIHVGQAAEAPKAVNVDPRSIKDGALLQAAAIAGAAASAAGHAERAAAHSVPEIKKQERPRPQARVEFTHSDAVQDESEQKTERTGTADQKPESSAVPEKKPEPVAESAEKAEKDASTTSAASENADQDSAQENARKVSEHGPFHMIIEAETAEEGLVIAIDELKYIHNEYGITNSAAKTTAEKLNERGFSKTAIEKLRGKDFIVEHAGALDPKIADQIRSLVETDETGMIIVLVDTPEGLDQLEDKCPDLFDLCDLVSDEYEEDDETAEGSEDSGEEAEGSDGDNVVYEEEPYEEEPYDETPSEQETEAVNSKKDDRRDGDRNVPDSRSAAQKPVASRASGGASKDAKENLAKPVEAAPDEEMEIDDFAQYCCQYASSIDCNITGKSMLALYERIELMEEDNIPLTKQTAEDLIEEAADRAEKPPIGKRLKGMFNSKYDKNGLLILKEEDFIH